MDAGEKKHVVRLETNPTLGALRAISYQAACNCGWKGRQTIFRDEALKEQRDHDYYRNVPQTH